MSLSARRAWIEIVYGLGWEVQAVVALRKESVDRNLHSRNRHNVNREVALRKESVDRNHAMQVVIVIVETSLSARRAWIEILPDIS